MSETVYIGVHAYEEVMDEGYGEFVECLDCDTYFLETGSGMEGTVSNSFDEIFHDTNGRGHLPSSVRERSVLHDRAVFSGYRANKEVAISAAVADEFYEEVLIDGDHTVDLVEGECINVNEAGWYDNNDFAFRRVYALEADVVSMDDLDF